MEEKDTTAKKSGNNKLIVIMALVIVILVLSIGALYLVHKSTEAKRAAEASKNAYQSAINKTASLIDAGEVYSIEAAPSLNGKARGFGEKAYKVQTERCDNIVFYVKNGKVILATFNKKDYYKNAKVVDLVSHYTLTVDEMTDYQQMTEDVIGNLLNTSSSITYPMLNGWKMTRNEPKVVVSSYADTINKAGKKQRHTFSIKFVKKSPKSVILDGKEYLN